MENVHKELKIVRIMKIHKELPVKIANPDTA